MSETQIILCWWVFGMPIALILDGWMNGEINGGSIVFALISGGAWPVLIVIALIFKADKFLKWKLWERK